MSESIYEKFAREHFPRELSRGLSHSWKTDTSLRPPCHKLWYESVSWHECMRLDVLPRFDMWRFHRTWAVEKSRNTRRPRSDWLPFINTGFTYPTPRIVRVRKKGTTASRTKGGEEIRTRGTDRRGEEEGFDRRKVGQETISPFSTDKYFMRFNPSL